MPEPRDARDSEPEQGPRADDADPWEDLLADLGGDDWAAADSRAEQAEQRRRRSGHALLWVAALALLATWWFARPAQLRTQGDPADSQDPALVLVAALSDEAFWSVERLSPRARALPGLAVFALAQAQHDEPSSILEQPLADASARLVAQLAPDGAAQTAPAAGSARDALTAILHGLALFEAGRSLGDPAASAFGRTQLEAALDSESAALGDGRLQAWRDLAQHSLSTPTGGPPRVALSEALGGPAGDDPVWRAAREILLRRR
ncbi:MAG: hypothetical protein DHS20C15_25070 [Planctomycetota bacterium]|nr:MAG: hypothetical protein DHS20C15_25070 [Planctomycetota bacterium]